MKRPIYILALLGILAIAAASHAREAVGTLAGTMVDSHGNPVADGVVVIQTSDGQHPHATHTDAHGHFEFNRFSIGQYDIRGSIYGVFTDWRRRVLIRAGKTTEVTLHLPAAVK
ncbi:MAG TPA: carboxypeptidase-like regulatory domain-containing protein [Candidatus Acidoferrum sp.]|nr:carboxypeptidase-like regulatory domain-containing protein [Candidatus Acidoferrum sp.]